PSVGTTGASGESTWPIGIVARGTPPKGQDQRQSSASAIAPGRASRRPAFGGTAIASTPNIEANSACATTYPGAVRSSIQTVAGNSHAAATNQARRKRALAG